MFCPGVRVASVGIAMVVSCERVAVPILASMSARSSACWDSGGVGVRSYQLGGCSYLLILCLLVLFISVFRGACSGIL
jgi:hypothetical protein